MPYENEDWIDFPLFDDEVSLSLRDEDDAIDQEYIKACVEMLQTLSERTIDKLCEGSIAYCEFMRRYFTELEITMPESIQSREILQYIHPTTLIIDPPDGDGVGLHIEMNCDWEPEHGLEWTILDGEALYVGAFSDEDPWRGYDYFKEASWNHLKLGKTTS